MKRLGFFLTAGAIAIQAFGHHSLAPYLTPSQLAIFETASRYLMWASIWSLVWAGPLGPDKKMRVPLRLIWTGVGLFCGSLFGYLIVPFKGLMMLTPMGGLLMIVGFVWLGWRYSEKEL